MGQSEHFNTGVRRFALGLYENAHQLFQQALAASPDDAEARELRHVAREMHDVADALFGTDQKRAAEQILAAKPTAEFDDAWGKGFMNAENFTRFAYQSLKR